MAAEHLRRAQSLMTDDDYLGMTMGALYWQMNRWGVILKDNCS